MRSFSTTPVDLLWLLLVPLGIGAFLLLRRPRRSGASVAVIGLLAVAWGWAVFYAWMYLTFERPSADTAFNSIEYLKKETGSSWLWRYLATAQGWIPGVIVFGIAWCAARLWPRRAPA